MAGVAFCGTRSLCGGGVSLPVAGALFPAGGVAVRSRCLGGVVSDGAEPSAGADAPGGVVSRWRRSRAWSSGAVWAGDVPGDVQAIQIHHARLVYAGRSLGDTRVVQPWADVIRQYQRFVFLPGTLLGLIVLAGGAGVLARRRSWGGLVLLPWLTGALLIVLPPMTAGFSYRYVLAAVPAACLAAGLAFALHPGDRERPARIVRWLARCGGAVRP